MKYQTIPANYLNTICWVNNTLVDWAEGTQYLLNGEVRQIEERVYAYVFDSAISTEDGMYSFIYERLGTKGLLLKGGELLREINRSYYCANAHEFPAAFVTVDDRTYLIHCPVAYNQLDFEDVETGELVTNNQSRKSDDIFHSRLEVSPGNTYLMSKGWVWHPLDKVVIYNVKECLNNTALLDESHLSPNVGVEICTASFINDNKVLIGSSNEDIDEDKIGLLGLRHVAVWDLQTNQLSASVPVKGDFGNLFAINDSLAWDLFEFPKIINFKTGDIVDQNKGLNTGQQNSSIINKTSYFPPIAFNRHTKQIAIKAEEQIEVLSPDDSIWSDI